MKQKIYIILVLLMSFGALRLHAQENVEVDDIVTGKAEVSATKSIRLTDGFHAVAGSNFHAHIDANAVDHTPSMATPAIIGDTEEGSATDGMNYVRSITYREAHSSEPTGAYKHLESIQYYDDLGRPIQTVLVGATPLGKDIVQPIAYDEFGRKARHFLPYVASTKGEYQKNDTVACKNYYKGNVPGKDSDEAPYGVTVFENSPLNRLTKQYGAGKDWHSKGKGSVISYSTNTSAISSWNENGTAISYPAKSLHITQVTDENGHISREYKDKMEQVVLKESLNGTETLKTYYIYDDYGLLRTVVPPLATSPADKELCYYYTYDRYGRLITKTTPGAKVVYLVYNKHDQLVLTQDGNMRAKNPGKYLFYKYDILNRPIINGFLETSKSITQIRDDFEKYTGNNYEKYNGSKDCYGYSKNNSFPSGYDINKADVLSVIWYDNYNFISDLGINDMAFSSHKSPTGKGYASEFSNKIKSATTGSLVKALEVNNSGFSFPNKELIDVVYYDKYGNVIKTVSKNHKGGYDVLHSKYQDFTYELSETTLQHKTNISTIDLSTIKQYKYDHAGRLLETSCKVNDEPTVVLSANKYNELGELVSKGLHSEDVSGSNKSFVQKVDYTYNVRGWITSINDPGLSKDGDLFGMKLYYNTNAGLNTSVAPGSEVQYNGNISAIVYGTAGDDVKNRGYAFTYDGLNRLKTAKYGEGISLASGHNKYNVTGNDNGIRYDKNGNIKNLQRFHNGSLADNLNYTYKNNNKSNQLLKVSDPSGDKAGLADYVQKPGNYAYDDNGNMTSDPAKEGTVYYNFLNLPERVVLGNKGTIFYHYDAAGNKLAKYTENSSSSENTTTEYIANLVYTNGKKSFFSTEEGRAIPIVENGKTHWHFEYNLKDHLGNTRVTFGGSSIAGAADIVQTSSYYPFGMVMTQQNYNSGGNSYQLNKYLYNGKELQANEFEGASLDWHDYGFRMYDASLGRWHVKDPLGESMSNVSPYSYCFNNPLSFVDEYGLYPRYDWDMSQYYDDEEERVVSPEEFMFWLHNGRYPDQPMEVQDPFWSNMVSSGDLTSYRAEVAWFSGWYREDGSFYTVSVKYRLQENQIHANSDGGSAQSDGGMPNWYQNISDAVNGGGFAATGLTYRAGKLVENASRYYTSSGYSLNYWKGAKPTVNLFRGLNVSAKTVANVGQTFKTIGTTAGVIGGAMIVGDVLYNSQVNASHVVNSFMTGIAFTGWGAPVAAVWFVADTGFAYFTDASLSQRIDSAVGGPLVDWEW